MTTETTQPDFEAKAQSLAAEWYGDDPQRDPGRHEMRINGLAAKVAQALQKAYEAGLYQAGLADGNQVDSMLEGFGVGDIDEFNELIEGEA